jgi:hypothetical protein
MKKVLARFWRKLKTQDWFNGIWKLEMISIKQVRYLIFCVETHHKYRSIFINCNLWFRFNGLIRIMLTNKWYRQKAAAHEKNFRSQSPLRFTQRYSEQQYPALVTKFREKNCLLFLSWNKHLYCICVIKSVKLEYSPFRFLGYDTFYFYSSVV